MRLHNPDEKTLVTLKINYVRPKNEHWDRSSDGGNH